MNSVSVLVTFTIVLHIRNILTQEIQSYGVLIDGDIMLHETENPWERSREIPDMKNKRWPGGIVPYQLNSTQYTPLDVYTIREGMKEIEKSTCIRFVPKTDQHDFIYITPNKGCWSYLGRIGSGQTLSLVAPQCIGKGTVIHELMHALGFWHEHTRFDRDEYVKVLWDNIMDDDKRANFAKHLNFWSEWTRLPYDYSSVMHYSAYAFSKRPTLPTLLPTKNHVRLRDFGRAKVVGTLTDTDREKINAFYECRETLLT